MMDLMTLIALLALFAIIAAAVLLARKYRKNLPTTTEEPPVETIAQKRSLAPTARTEHDLNLLGVRQLPADFKVERVHTENGSHIEPPLEGVIENATDLDKLVWHLAVLKADTGLEVSVSPARMWINNHPVYGNYQLSTENAAMGTGNFHETWHYINGINTGYELTKGTI